jgi:septal ring-binding cell division protein DamX
MSDEGQIGEIDLIERLVGLGRERFTGAIRFEQDGIIKIVYFKEGDVLSASTNDRTDAVDEILLRAGKVSKDHVKQALSKRKENESLGDALLNLGFITRKELAWGRRIQVIGILRSVRTWDHGQYAIVADYLPKREEGTHFPLQQILIELYVTEQDRQPFERALDGGSAVLAKVDGFDEAFQKLGLNDEAAEIAANIDGTRSAAEIASSSGKDVFNTYKLLEAMRVLGLLKKEVKPDELGFASIGVADADESFSTDSNMASFSTEPAPPVEPTGEEAPPPAAAVPVAVPNDVQWGVEDESAVPEPAPLRTPKPLTLPPATIPNPITRPSRPTMSQMATQTQTRRTPPSFTRAQPKPKRQAPVFALIVILILAGASLAGWYWWSNRAKPVAQQTIAPPRPTPKPQVEPPKVVSAEVGGNAPQMEKSGGQPPSAVPPPAPQPAPKPTPQPPPRQPKPAVVHESAGKFTIQVELVCQQSSLQKATEIGGATVWSAPITFKGKECYRVFWGHFATRADAEAATSQVPEGLRASKPVVVSIP